jgi:tRNA (Thr-GGU) A37 N-methylase
MNFVSIGVISSPYTTIEGMPIQPLGAEGAVGEAHLHERFAEGLRDLEGFSHVILIYCLHRMSGYAASRRSDGRFKES